MAKSTRKADRAARRRSTAIANIMVIGALLVALPLFMGKMVFGKAFAPIAPLGWLLLIGGGIVLWLTTPAANPDTREGAPKGDPDVKTPGSAFAMSPTAALAPAARPAAWSAAVFEAIEWRRFEAVVEALFAQAGFETKTQPHGADGGVDLWLYSKAVPGEAVSLVQCKHWQGKRVGVDKIRELRGVMAAHKVSRGQFATTSTFTEDAQAFAQANQINLLDVDALLDLIAKRTPEQQKALLDVALQGEYWRPTCVNCGEKMTERTPRQGGSRFWGCVNYPRCKTTLPMRGA